MTFCPRRLISRTPCSASDTHSAITSSNGRLISSPRVYGTTQKLQYLLQPSMTDTKAVGPSARGAGSRLVDLAEALDAPVATTIQGKGVFPESHPLWLWNGLGRSTPKFARQIFDGADALLALARLPSLPNVPRFLLALPLGLVAGLFLSVAIADVLVGEERADLPEPNETAAAE